MWTFDVFLTVHLSIFISVFNQIDAQNFFHSKFYFMSLHVSSTCAHHQEVKIVLHSLWYNHTYRWPSRARDGNKTLNHNLSHYLTNLMHKNLFHSTFYFMLLHVSNTCAHHQEVKIVLYSLWYHPTYRWPSRARDGNKTLNHNLSHYLTNLMHKICFTVSFISCLYMFWAHVLETCRDMK